MKSTALFLASGLAAIAALPAAAQDEALGDPIECGQNYQIQTGDTLSRIAIRAYGSPANYQLIYSANTAIIGPNPGAVEVGATLFIPCLDGELPAPVAQVQPIEAAPAAAADTPSSRLRIVTASDWAPYHNEDQSQGGMLTEVVSVALSKVVGPNDFKIDFINDWSAQIDPLITDGAYDVSLSWSQPNCDAALRLSVASRFQCNNLIWSTALYEHMIGYYTLATASAPLSHSDLFGKTICRAEGHGLFALEEFDLQAPNVTVFSTNRTTDCFEAVMAGDADVVVMAADTAQGAMGALGLGDRFVRHEALDYRTTMHAVSSADNPDGVAHIALLDEGIRQLKDSGEWFAIIRRHLTEHRLKSGS